MATKKLTKAQQYNADFAKTVARLARTRKSPFSVDDVTAKIGQPPQGRKALGALMNAAVKANGLDIVNYVPAKSPSRRGALNNAYAA